MDRRTAGILRLRATRSQEDQSSVSLLAYIISGTLRQQVHSISVGEEHEQKVEPEQRLAILSIYLVKGM